MLRFDPPSWDRATTLPSIVHPPYLLTTNVVPADEKQRERLIASPHSHPDTMLAWCHRGCIWLHLRDSVRKLTPQRGLWVPAGVAHTAHQEQGSVACFTYVHSRARWGDIDSVKTASIPRAVREMLLYLDSDEVGHNLRIAMQGALVQMLQASTASGAAPALGHIPLPSDDRVRELVAAVLDAPGSRNSLVELARAHQVHERTAARIFIKEVGTTFGRWRTLVRMTLAEGLLTEGKTVAAVAAECGYDSASAFSAVFKSHAGLSPRDYLTRVTSPIQ